MNIKILYHAHYFERELFLIQKDNFFFKVYQGSGLNGGKKGRVLPFTRLQDTLPRFSEARAGVVPGYIFKEFFYRGYITSHGKRLNNFPDEIQLFADDLEKTLNEYDTSSSSSSSSSERFENIEYVLENAKKINIQMNILIQNSELKPFDWFDLVKEK